MQIKSAKYLISSPSYEKCPVANKPEYAFIGRSNVGKSSLINMLVNQRNLAKTSATPGKTQLINHFLINDSWYLVDLPGYGYAKRSQRDRNRWEQMIENYLRKRENLINVFVLIDVRHSPQQNDLAFINKLGEWQIPFVLVFTKADKEKPNVVLRNEKLFLEKMKETWQFLPQSFITSSEKKQGREELLDFINTCNKNL
ncbi:MAG: ribosome biogenesis GTP-binding protein YihA/YsxC [Chitinophagales bacterium]|nr:ribosome biogenesis GTP-binding protein YihA/YsxC [Chitinophagales bacterium]